MTTSRDILQAKTRFKRFLSFSAVDQFSTCERRYFFERIMGQRQPDTPITLVGRTYHEAIAAMLHTRLERTDEWVELVVGEAVTRNHDALTAQGVQCGSLRAEMVSNLKRLRTDVLAPVGVTTLDAVAPYGRKRSWWIERDFSDEALGYKGVIDLLSLRVPVVDTHGTVTGGTDGRCVWDWKSVTFDRRRSQRDAETSAQLALYALAANVRRACFVEIPRNLEKDLRVRVVTYTEQDLRDWAQWLGAMRDAILARGRRKVNFRPADRKSPLCSPIWCPWYVTKCYPADSLLTPTTEEVTVEA